MDAPANSASITVRAATAADSQAIAALVAELGYPAAAAEIPGRLAALGESRQTLALVADIGADVIGLATAHVLSTIHAPAPVALLTALVVLQRARGSGAGRQLVERVESWARDEGAVRIAVTSGSQRADAHAFYRRIGYEQTGLRFAKKL